MCMYVHVRVTQIIANVVLKFEFFTKFRIIFCLGFCLRMNRRVQQRRKRLQVAFEAPFPVIIYLTSSVIHLTKMMMTLVFTISNIQEKKTETNKLCYKYKLKKFF